MLGAPDARRQLQQRCEHHTPYRVLLHAPREQQGERAGQMRAVIGDGADERLQRGLPCRYVGGGEMRLESVQRLVPRADRPRSGCAR